MYRLLPAGLAVFALPLFAGCGGGGGGGGGGAGHADCPDSCLDGQWNLTMQVQGASGSACGLLGLEALSVSLAPLPSADPTTPIYELLCADLVMPVPGGGVNSTLAVLVPQTPLHRVALAGFCYVPDLDITVGLATGMNPIEQPDIVIETDHFVTFIDYATYAGNVMVGTPDGSGYTTWSIDPAAPPLCEGHLRVEGLRTGLQSSSTPPPVDLPTLLVGEWRVPGTQPIPIQAVVHREDGEMFLQFPQDDALGQPPFPADLLIQHVQGSPDWLAPTTNGDAIVMLRSDDLQCVFAGVLEVPIAGRPARGAIILRPEQD